MHYLAHNLIEFRRKPQIIVGVMANETSTAGEGKPLRIPNTRLGAKRKTGKKPPVVTYSLLRLHAQTILDSIGGSSSIRSVAESLGVVDNTIKKVKRMLLSGGSEGNPSVYDLVNDALFIEMKAKSDGQKAPPDTWAKVEDLVFAKYGNFRRHRFWEPMQASIAAGRIFHTVPGKPGPRPGRAAKAKQGGGAAGPEMAPETPPAAPPGGFSQTASDRQAKVADQLRSKLRGQL